MKITKVTPMLIDKYMFVEVETDAGWAFIHRSWPTEPPIVSSDAVDPAVQVGVTASRRLNDTVVESFVAMLRETPYRPALSEEEALSVLQENWEMRYDPNVIEQFIALKQVDQGPLDIDSLLVGQAPV